MCVCISFSASLSLFLCLLRERWENMVWICGHSRIHSVIKFHAILEFEVNPSSSSLFTLLRFSPVFPSWSPCYVSSPLSCFCQGRHQLPSEESVSLGSLDRSLSLFSNGGVIFSALILLCSVIHTLPGPIGF